MLSRPFGGVGPGIEPELSLRTKPISVSSGQNMDNIERQMGMSWVVTITLDSASKCKMFTLFWQSTDSTH